MDYDEEGEPSFDPGARLDKQTSAQGQYNWERGDAFSAGAESGEHSTPKSKSRKRLISRIDDGANHQRLPGHASDDEELFDEPVVEVLRKKARKEKSSRQRKNAESGGMLDKLALLANCGKQSEKPQPSRACSHARRQQGGKKMKHLLDSIAQAENNEDNAVLAKDDDALIDHTGVDPEVSVAGSEEEADSSGDAPQAEEGEENDDLNSNCKLGMSKSKNYEGKAEDTALLVEEFMARLEVAAEEDAELNRQSKPAINKQKMLPSLLSVLSKRQLQQEFLDRGVLSVLKNWLESLPDGSLSNMTLRSALLKLITEKGETSNSHHKVSDSPNMDVALTSRTTKPDNLTIVREEPPSVTSQTQACQDVLRNIFSTEEFGILSNMLNYGSSSPSGSLEATLQSKASTSLSSFLDLELISLRFSSGVYGHTPQLFSDDIQQVWKNVHSFGSTLVKLAGELSEYSDKLYKDQVLSLFQVQHNNTAASKCEELMVLSGHTTEAGSQALMDSYRAGGKSRQRQRIKQATNLLATRNSKHYTADGVCKECGLKESVNSIVCSHCHAVYHKECVNLNSESSPRGWYCPSCTIKTDGGRSRIITSRQGTRRNHSSLQTQVSIHKQMTNETSQSCKAAVKVIDKGGVCQVCGKYDEDVLLCDTCDDAYHMYCLAPPIDNVPEGFWYCPKCAELEKKSVVVHENPHVGHHCAVCDRLWIESLQAVAAEHLEEGGVSASVTESPEHTADSVGMQSPPQLSAHKPNVCKVCRVANKKPKISCSGCEKRFHLSCLGQTVKKKPNGVWYCPSCLCRVCKVDANDDKIVLCDDCDEAYHIYCLVPALPEIPEGSWYCPSCVG